MPPTALPWLKRWVNTLKFQIIAIAVTAGVLSAVATAGLVLDTTEAELTRQLLQADAGDSEATAALLATKLHTLQRLLGAVAGVVEPGLWHDPVQMTQFLADKAGVNELFDSVVAVGPDGQMLARLEKGKPITGLANLSDRDYIRAAFATKQLVVSRPLISGLTGLPIVVIAIPVASPDGGVAGILAGTLSLRSTGMFSGLGGGNAANATRYLVIDREGRLLAHPDPRRVLGNAADEPGLAEVFRTWHAMGSPIDTRGRTTLSGDFIVSMAGIARADWTQVRLTPQAAALEPVAAARRTAWRGAGAVGLLVGMLAGLLAWAMTRPISVLRARAETLLADDGAALGPWPDQSGEVGALARSFRQVVEQRQQRQAETQAMLRQLQAVLAHAEVGIAFTRKGHFELVSSQFCRIFGCDEGYFMGRSTRAIHPSEAAYKAMSERALPMFIEHGGFDGEVELVRQDGEAFWGHLRGRAIIRGDQSQGTIWILDDVTDVREQRERLAWTSSHDGLTGLTNRAAFEVLLEEATERAGERPFCALFIDLDRFKEVNDNGGHAAGDALLRELGSRLAAQVRKSDTVARLGGDEFAVLLSDCPLSQAHTIAEQLRSAVVSYQLSWEGRQFGVGASIGLVRVDATFASAADVLAAADAACYEAKRLGRDQVSAHGAPMRRASMLRLV